MSWISTRDETGNLVMKHHIAARIEKLHILWWRDNFTTMTERYRSIRGGARYKGFKCYWCKHEFENEDVIDIVSIKEVGNRVACKQCRKKYKTTE